MPLTVVPFFSTLAAKAWVGSLVRRLEATGAQVMTAEVFRRQAAKREQSPRSGHNVVFVGTGGTERAIADFVSDVRLPLPIILLSHDGNNSLPAAMEIRTYLEQRGFKARIVHASLDSLMERIRDWCFFVRIEERLRTSRIGLVGKPSSWLVASRVSPSRVRRQWGAVIEKYPLTALLDLLDEPLTPHLESSLERFTAQAVRTSVPHKELVRAGAMAQALTRFVRTNKLDAVTIECFELLQQTDITGCYGVSLLNDLPDVVGGCEGDIATTFTMLLAKLLTGQPGFMANVSDVDLDTNSAVFAHCTVATTMVDTYDIMTHFESGKSVAIGGQVMPQPVTVLKALGEDFSRYWVSSGHITSHTTTTTGCRTQIRVRLDEPVDYFLEQSLANHHVLLLGNHVRMFRDFFRFVLRE